MLARECKKELTEHIIPFWNSLEDNDNGGFYGYVGNDLTLDKKRSQGRNTSLKNTLVLLKLLSCVKGSELP